MHIAKDLTKALADLPGAMKTVGSDLQNTAKKIISDLGSTNYSTPMTASLSQIPGTIGLVATDLTKLIGRIWSTPGKS